MIIVWKIFSTSWRIAKSPTKFAQKIIYFSGVQWQWMVWRWQTRKTSFSRLNESLKLDKNIQMDF